MSEEYWDQLSDAELVERALAPASPQLREQALKAIYDKHAQDVLGLCGYWLHDPDAAMDAAQSAFAVMLEELPTLRDPSKLGPWLRGIAKHRCQEVWRQRGRTGDYPDQDLEDAEHEVKASRRRKAEVDRMLDVVAASLTERQEQIYQLVLRQDMRGHTLAAQLGISEKEANDATYENQALLADGFGAYVLARDGRRYCTNLGRILDQSGWDGQTFHRVLRLRILRHLDDCPKLCDNCATCNPQKRKLIAAYTPVTIPILIAGALRDRVYRLIEQLTAPSGPGDSGPPGGSGPSGNADADAAVGAGAAGSGAAGSGAAGSGAAGSGTEATLDAVITRSSGGGPGTAAATAASRLTAMADAAAGSATADALVGRMQSLVRKAAQSSRLPRRLRRAIPQDPGPGTSVAIVSGAIVAAIVVVAILAAAASALTSGSPAPQAGEGGVAIAQGSQSSSPAPASYNPTITGPTYVDMIPSTMLESHVIDVNLIKVVDPAQETNVGDVVAGNGYRLVAIVFQIKCISGGEYAEPEVQISTSDGQDYSPVIAGIVGYPNALGENSSTISAGETDTFLIPYLIPDGVKVTGVEWKPYLYDSSDQGSHGEWTVQE
jgi:RNA polymerase sigma factor (sigma-70 family)